MSIVLFDGSQPSVKALEAGAAPGFFGNHNKQQLVVVHATRPKIFGATAGANLTSFASKEIGGSGSLDHDAGDMNANSTSLKNNNNQGDNNSSSNNNNAASSIASITSVIPMVSDLINKNRYAAPSLNYKVETFRLFQGPAVTVQQERQREQELLQQLQLQAGGAGGGGAGNNKSMKQTLQQQQQQQQQAAALLLQQQQQKEKQDQQQLLLNRSADGESTGDQESGKLTDPHSFQANFADSIAARAQHHNLRAILLGVGSSGGHGKSLTIGSFARAVIEKLRGNAKVCDVVGIFKPSGPPVRANQPMRIALVVTPNTTFDDIKTKMLSKLACLSQTRGDYVSLFVIMNDGKAKPVSLTNAIKDIEQARSQQAALGQQNITPIPTSEEQLSLINFEQDSTPQTNWKQVVDKVKNLAKQVAGLGFLNQEEKIRRDNNNNNEAGGDEHEQEQEHQEEEQEKAPSVVGGMTTTNTIAATTVAGAAGFEGPSLLNCFWIEPTNRDPAPSLDSNTGCIQFSKAVGGLKIDYAVLAGSLQISGVGQAPTNSLLSANRPHVLLV